VSLRVVELGLFLGPSAPESSERRNFRRLCLDAPVLTTSPCGRFGNGVKAIKRPRRESVLSGGREKAREFLRDMLDYLFYEYTEGYGDAALILQEMDEDEYEMRND